MSKKKTHDNKRDFIKLLMSMSDVELNDYILKYGKPPKKVLMCRIINK
jgi:hypothetical protein